MKILHYISSFSLPSETFIYDAIINLENNGVNNFVLCHNRYLLEQRPFAKVKIISAQTPLLKKIYHKILHRWYIINYKPVIHYINELKPDIIHCHFGPNGINMANTLTKNNITMPVVISMHGTDTTHHPIKYPSYKNTLQHLAKLKNIHFTFPSRFLLQEFQKNVDILPINKDILPNAFNPIFLGKSSHYKKPAKQTFNIVTVARLIYWKGLDYLIDAAYLLDKEYKNWQLHIIGNGDYKKKLLARTREKGISDKILFYGSVPHSDITPILQKQNLYIQPSVRDTKTGQTESFGIGVVEAIVSGLPVIVSNVGGLPDTVLGGDKKFAKVVEEKSPAALLNAIKEMMALNEENTTFKNKVIDKYSQSAYLKSLRSIYQQAL